MMHVCSLMALPESKKAASIETAFSIFHYQIYFIETSPLL